MSRKAMILMAIMLAAATAATAATAFAKEEQPSQTAVEQQVVDGLLISSDAARKAQIRAARTPRLSNAAPVRVRIPVGN